MNVRHSLQFFKCLDQRGRPDLAAINAAVDGRLRLAMYYWKRSGLDARSAWKESHRLYRSERWAL